MNNKELTRIFKALGNERRLLILKYLSKKRELNVGQISKLLNLSFKSVSKHLLILDNVNLVKSNPRGLNKFYSINQRAPREILQFLNLNDSN